MILVIALGHIAYGALTIYLASLDAADLPPKIFNAITATGATWVEWKRTFFWGGIYTIGVGGGCHYSGNWRCQSKDLGKDCLVANVPCLVAKTICRRSKKCE